MSKIRLSTKILVVVFILNLILSFTLFANNTTFTERTGEPQKEDTKKYQKVYNLILEKNWKEAKYAIRDFVKAFPKSRYLDDVYYWDTYALEKMGTST